MPLPLSSDTVTIKQALSFKQYDHQHRIRVITLSSASQIGVLENVKIVFTPSFCS